MLTFGYAIKIYTEIFSVWQHPTTLVQLKKFIPKRTKINSLFCTTVVSTIIFFMCTTGISDSKGYSITDMTSCEPVRSPLVESEVVDRKTDALSGCCRKMDGCTKWIRKRICLVLE
ncbi:hypothetical protein K501DRAFT_268964 [Backusella circina FSU 941]|nr:hypothetical protein K501DRAFT_268964 [Backusella circina FSU 941]